MFGLALPLAVACNHNAPKTSATPLAAADLVLVGCDETTAWDDKLGLVPAAGGADELLFVDFRVPNAPRVQSRIPLRNSVYGPPTNMVVSRSGRIALVASSINMTQVAGKWNNSPDNQVHVLDLSDLAKPSVSEVEVGKQPSGIDISPDGSMALVANRKGRSVSVLNLRSTPVQATAELAIDAEAADVKFTPDGKRAVVSNWDSHSVTFLEINDGKVTVSSRLEVGAFPYSVAITPNGKLALVGNMGDKTGADGNDDTVTVIDLQTSTVLQHLAVGDGPEGLAISPDGTRVAVVLLNGSNASIDAPYHHKNGQVRLLSVDGMNVVAHAAVEVGTMAEGARFSADGTHIIAGNFRDRDLSVLSVTGTELKVVGRVPLGCRPGSLK
jgi:YVTN family beta-propeller protein